MQTLTLLCFESQAARQRLREICAEPHVPANAANWDAPSGIGSRRYLPAKQVPRIESTQQLRASGSLSHNLFWVIGSLFGKLHCDKSQSHGATGEPAKSRMQPPARGFTRANLDGIIDGTLPSQRTNC
jgi:hypothetical protein